MFHNLGPAVKIVRLTVDGTNYEKTAGTGDALTSGSIDTQGYDAALIMTQFGAITASGTVTQTIQASPDNSTWNAIKDANGGANQGNAISYVVPSTAQYGTLEIDIYRPTDRYLRVINTRATANAAIDTVTVILYRAGYEAAPLDATEIATVVYNHPSY